MTLTDAVRNRLRRAASTINLLESQQALITKQQRLIDDILHEIQSLKLEHNREMLGMVSAWRIHMETPEIDLRDDITALANELGNQIAALEEHVV